MKTQLYPELRGRLAGKDQRTAANMLLDFVQTAFKYKTDVEQFGKERAFLRMRHSSIVIVIVRTGPFCIPCWFVTFWDWM